VTLRRPVIGYLHHRCLITEELRDQLEAIGDLRLVEPTVDGLADVDILCTFAGFFLERKLLEQLPRLIATVDLGTAIHCDVAAAADLGIVVYHAPGTNAQAVGEHTMALLLALTNGIIRSDRRMRTGDFMLADRRAWGVELQGRVLGLVGFGNVARRVAHIAHNGFNMQVRVWCRHPEDAEAAGYEFLELDELMRVADVLSVHLALNPETRGLIDRSLLSLLKPSAFVVVTARVEVLDLDALTALVVDEHIAGAALDTWPDHSPDYSSPLLQHDNVVLTEANAGLSDVAAENMAAAALDGVRSALGHTLPNLATIANPLAWPPRALVGSGSS
jgi:phosphoglycerate dehydrogenase-like enzyme